VVAWRCLPVFSSVTVTLASETAELEGSVTYPEIVPTLLWACAKLAETKTVKNASKRMIFIRASVRSIRALNEIFVTFQ
jgi:hypothetical protein